MWRDHGATLVLKPFLQASSMQLLFDSYPYAAQRSITRLLLGLTSQVDDGEEIKTEEVEEGMNSWFKRPEKR